MNSLSDLGMLYDDINHMNYVSLNKNDFIEEQFANIMYRAAWIVEQLLRIDNVWKWLIGPEKNNCFNLSENKKNQLLNEGDAVEKLLPILMGNGMTVKQLIWQCNDAIIENGNKMTLGEKNSLEQIQLVLGRKYLAVEVGEDCNPILIEPSSDDMYIIVTLQTKAFPSPLINFYLNDTPLMATNVDDQDNVRYIVRCECLLKQKLKCTISNEVTVQDYLLWHLEEKEISVNLGPIDLEKYISEERLLCFECKKQQIDEVLKETGDESNEENKIISNAAYFNLDTTNMVLEASDKVALIIANRNYQILDLGLRTPLSDAETLAEKLQEMNFKTVVLADLTLDEMKRMIVEFTNLLSDNVYAVFYFVGHGFQINGQCFLLPINNLIDMYLPEHCLPMNWILHKFMEFNTGMHVILLDICRYEEPVNPLEFHLRAKQIFKIPQKIPVKPNTIFGFATSTGGSSYEVVGEKNGVFMKYLKHHLSKDIPVLSMLQKVFRDVQNDPLISHVQVPEFTCNLAYPRRLTDPLVTTGYTQTFNVHNLTWCNMHRLPDPVTLGVDADNDICITIWIDFCGHFTNKCYIYSNVCKKEIENEDSAELNNNKLAYRACLEFDEPLSVANPRLSEDPSEGVTLSYLVSGLQKVNGKVDCTISLFKVDENDEVMEDNIIMKKTVSLGYILITRLFENE